MTVRIGWTIDYRWRLGYIDGRRLPPILTHFDGGIGTMGRGGVLLLGPLMVWWTRDEYEVML